jgi:flagellar hook protein FlgE
MTITNSLFIGISGLQAHGEAISIVGDNIANVSTIGYKRDRASFSDMLGGELDAQRLGGGARLTAPQRLLDQGAVTLTGNPLDLALRGGGMFVVKGSHNGQNSQFYTRDGRFTIDNTGFVTNQQGLRLQGFVIDSTGRRALSATDLPIGTFQSQPVATTTASMKLNLDAGSVTPAAFDPTDPNATSNYATSATVYDSLGKSHHVETFFRNAGAGAWEWHAMVDGGDLTAGTAGTLTEIGNGTMTFNTDGSLQTQAVVASSADFLNATPGQTIAFSFGDDIASGGTGFAGTTQYAAASSVNGLDINGHGAGKLTDVTISDNGTVRGIFDNGDKIDLAQVALADFANEEGLTRVGDGLDVETTASGKPLIDVSGTGARGGISSGALEASNVDLSNELVTLIQFQRAFQANAKTVTTADEMLNDVNSLKR